MTDTGEEIDFGSSRREVKFEVARARVRVYRESTNVFDLFELDSKLTPTMSE